jgi:hypothetical protein
MRRNRTTVFTAGAGIMLLAASIPAVSAQQSDALAPPPTPDTLVEATNAMMRPGDLTGALSLPVAGRTFSTGFFNPPGGQDPFPVCIVPTASFRTVSASRTLATGFTARIGTGTPDLQFAQDVYQYPSEAAADRAWNQLSTAIGKSCNGSKTDDGRRMTVKSTRIPGLPGGDQGWGVLTSGSMSNYVTAHRVDGGIQVVVYYRYGRKSVPQVTPAAQSAINGLAATLAQRWQSKATLPVTQDSALTTAERTMVQPGDVPAALPIGKPARGAWSTFQASTPGTSLQACNAPPQLPSGSQSFWMTLGGNGDVAPVPGFISQYVYQYDSASQAQQVWQQLASSAATCTQGPKGSLSGKGEYQRTVNGVSALTVNGTPGVWVRTIYATGSNDFSFTTKTYTIFLLVNDTIQQLTYGPSTTTVGQIPLDQLAVNQLAETLANRWVANTTN